jgi:tRNA A37 threonylcarbamoyladenosine dehydratase
MNERTERTTKLIGSAAQEKLTASRILLFGVGGVGSYVLEALARAGIGAITIVDKDEVDITNINRQIIALTSTIGKPKVEVAKARAEDINPDIIIKTHQIFYGPGTAGEIDFSGYDYVIDAVDNVTAKLLIIEKSKAAGVPVISCMGTGNKLDPSAFRITDIEKTEYDPLAKVIRKQLRERGIKKVKVCWSPEPAAKLPPPPASISFVPATAGLRIAAEVIKSLI